MHHPLKRKLIGSTEQFWENAYRRNISKMIGICYRFTANRQLSEDLAHDAFLKAIEKSASFKGKGAFDAWLRRITVNQALQYLRDRKHKIAVDWAQQESSIIQIADTHSGAHPAGPAEFSEKELLEAINDLPEHHRLVFNLYVIDKFTHVQIGKELGISPEHPNRTWQEPEKSKAGVGSKAGTRSDGKDWQRSVPLLFLPFRSRYIERLYSRFSDLFGILPEKVRLMDFSRVPVHAFQRGFTLWGYATAAVSVGMITAAAFFAYNSSFPLAGKTHAFGSDWYTLSAYEGGNAPGLAQKSSKGANGSENGQTINYSGNNFPGSSLSTATIFPDSIILDENKKNTSMKNLDSLWALLFMASSVLPGPVDQPVVKAADESNVRTENQVSAGEGGSAPFNDAVQTGAPTAKSNAESGTIYAEKIRWSEKNHEVYLEGKVKVDFVDNRFSGNGSFTFLGPVHFLIFNGEPVALGSALKLLRKGYYLTRLDEKEAVQKYGEKGRQGAVEISVID